MQMHVDPSEYNSQRKKLSVILRHQGVSLQHKQHSPNGSTWFFPSRLNIICKCMYAMRLNSIQQQQRIPLRNRQCWPSSLNNNNVQQQRTITTESHTETTSSLPKTHLLYLK